jgi:voltage-gated potassium channel
VRAPNASRSLTTIDRGHHPGQTRDRRSDLRDRLYELLEHDHLPHSVGSRFAQLIVAIIVLDVLAMILASVPELDASFGWLFTSIEVLAVVVFALEYLARLWSVVGHSLRAVTPARARLEYVFSSLGIIDLLASCRRRLRWSRATAIRWCCSACCRS